MLNFHYRPPTENYSKRQTIESNTNPEQAQLEFALHFAMAMLKCQVLLTIHILKGCSRSVIQSDESPPPGIDSDEFQMASKISSKAQKLVC